MTDPRHDTVEPLPLDQIDLLQPLPVHEPLTDLAEAIAPKPAAPVAPTGTASLPGSGRAKPRGSVAQQYADIDWPWIEELRTLAAAQLSRSESDDEAIALQKLANRDTARDEARPLVSDLVEQSIQDRLRTGLISPAEIRQHQTVEIVLDALFGMGRLQPLLDQPTIENIDFLAYDRVILEHSDGHLEDGPKIFSSDDEMRSWISFIASRDGGRAFSPARPNLDLKLPGGERLSATSWVSADTYMTIRRHRLTDIRLDELVRRRECTDLVAGYLAAIVKLKRSLVVAGQQGAGKTTLVRALCHEIDPDEQIGTFETELELGLHEMGYFRRVKAFEARPGSGERGVDGRQAGEITVDDLLYNSFRMNLERQIVGEVRGREVLAMIKAMQSGSGSLSTTHSANAEGAVHKLITCALEAGPHVTLDYATRAVADGIDVVVYVKRADVNINGVPTRLRYISEVAEIETSGDANKGFSVTPVFAVTPDSPYVAVPQHHSRFTEDLDPTLFNRDSFVQLSPFNEAHR